MKIFINSLFFSLLFCLNLLYCDIEINSKAEKYLQLLLKKPKSGYIFDKFYLAWLDSASSKDLDDYLKEKSKNSPSHKILLSFYYKKTGHDIEALKVLKELLEKTNDSANLLFEKSQLESNTLNFENCIVDLKLALSLEMGPELKMKVLKHLGKAQLRNQDIKGALATWGKMASEFKDEDIEEDILELKISEGLYEEAEKHCLKLIALAKQPRVKVALYLRLGDIHQRNGAKDKALIAYSKTLSMVGKGSWFEKEIIAQISHVYNLDGDSEGLIEKMSELSKEYPDKIRLLKELSKLYVNSDQTEKALDIIKQILKIEPGIREHTISYINILKKTSKLKEALEVLEKLVKSYPKDGELLIDLALLYHKMENRELCEQKIDDYLKLNSKNQYQFLRAGQILTNFHYTEKATQVYRNMLSAFPSSLEAKENLATHLFSINKKEEALGIYKENASSGGIDMLLRTCRILNNIKEYQLSYDLLNAKKANYHKEYAYQQLLCECQLLLKKNNDAKDTALKILTNINTITQYKKGLSYLRQACSKKEELKKIADSIQSSPIVNLQCLNANIALIQGDIEKASLSVDKLLTQHPKHLLLNLLNLKIKVTLQEWGNAIEITKKLMELDKNQKIQYIKKIIDFEINLNQTDNAMRWIADWKKNAPGQIEPYLREAAIYTSQSKNEESLNVYKKASIKFPESEDILGLLANAYASENQLDDAQRIYWKLIAVSKDLSAKMSVTYNMIHAMMMHSSLDSLKRIFEEKMKQDKNAIYPIMALSAIYQSEGDYEGRRRYLLKATELRSNDVSLLHEIANIEASEGEYDKAIATLEKADSFDNSTKSKMKLAEMYLNKGDEDKNLEYLLKIIGQGKSNLKSFESITESLIISKQLEQALSVIQNGLKKFPSHYRLLFLKGVIYEELQQFDDASLVFQQLTFFKEVKDHKQVKTTPQHFMMSGYLQLIPKEIAEIYKNMNLEYRLYQYRRQRRASRHSRFTASLGRIMLPNNLETTHSYSIGHLKKIFPQLDEDKQEELVNKLESNGLNYAKLKLQLNHQTGQAPSFWDEMQAQYPNDKFINLIKIQNISRRTGLNEEFIKTYNDIKIKNPEYAALLYMSAMNKGDVDAKIIEEIFKLCETNNYLALMYVSQVSQMAMRNQSLNDEIKTIINKHTLALYPTIKQKNPWIVNSILINLTKNEDSSILIAFIDNLLKENLKPQNIRMYGYGNQNQSIIIPHSFPPNKIGKFPPSILGLFTGKNMYGGGGAQLDSTSLAKNIEKAKNPILKILIANFCEKEDLIKESMKNLINPKKPSLEQYLLKSSWLAEQDKKVEAVNLLNKARYLTLSLSDRKLIDGTIIGLGIDSDNKLIIASGVKAALRLKMTRLNVNEKKALVSAMEALGMEKEAAKLDEKLSKTNIRQSYTHRSRHNPTTNIQSNKINKLLDEKEYDRAAKLLYREYSAFCRGFFTNQQNQNVYENSLDKFWKHINNKFLKEKMNALLIKNTESKSITKMVELAYYYEKTGDAKNAISLYKEILKKNKKQAVAGIRLATLMIKEKEDGWKKIIASVIKSANIDQLATSLTQSLSSHNSDFEYKINALSLFEEIIKGSHENKYTHFQWFGQCVSLFSRSFYHNSVSIPELNNKNYKKYYDKLEIKNRDLADKKLSSFKSFLRSCLEQPKLSLKAFKYIHAYNQYFEFGSANLILQCEDAIKKHASKPSTIQQNAQNFSSHSTTSIIKFEEPITFYFKNKKQSEIVAFIEELKELKNKGFVQKITSQYELYISKKEDFRNLTKKYIQKNKNYGYSQNLTALNEVIAIWNIKNEKVEIEELILAEVKNNIQNYYLGNTIGKYIDTVFNKNKDIDEIKNFINKLKNVYLNKLIVKPSSTPSNSPFILQKLQAYFRCLSTSLQKDQLRFVIIENIEPELLKSPWVDQLGINNASINSITIDSFLYSPYIKGVSDYKNYALNKYNGSMLYMLIYKTSYSKNKTEIIKKLEGIKKQTFGTKFLIYAINNYKQNAILEYLSEYLPQIQQETDEIQQNFCETIYHLIYNRNSSRTSSISTKAGLFKSYMDKKMSVSKNAEIESFLKRTVPYNNHYSYVEQAKSLLKELIGINQDAFEKVYEKASKNLKNVRTNSTRNGVVQTYDMILRQSISESVRTIKEFLFIQKFNKKQIKTSYTFNNNVMNIISNEFVSLYKNKFSELNKLNKEIQSKNRINSFLYAIRKVSLLLKKDLVPYNIYSIKNSVYDKKERENILDTLSKDAEFNLLKKDSQFINELLADLKYSWASPQSNQIPSDFLQVISKRFNNSELSNSQKIAYYTLYYKKFASKININELVKLALDPFVLSGPDIFDNSEIVSKFPIILETFNLQKKTEQWETNANSLYNNFIKASNKLLRNKTHNSTKQRDENLVQFSLGMLETLLKLNDSQKIKKFFNHSFMNLNKDPIAYMMLLENGFEEIFLEGFNKYALILDYGTINNVSKEKCNIANVSHRFGTHITYGPLSDTVKTKIHNSIAKITNKEYIPIANMIYSIIYDVDLQKQTEDFYKTETTSEKVKKILTNLLLRPGSENSMKNEWIEYCSNEDICDIYYQGKQYEISRYNSFLKILFEEEMFKEINDIIKGMSNKLFTSNNRNQNNYRVGSAHQAICSSYNSFTLKFPTVKKYQTQKMIDMMYELGETLLKFDGINNYTNGKYNLLQSWLVYYLLKSPKLENTKEETLKYKGFMGKNSNLYGGYIQTKLDKFTFLKLEKKDVLNIYQCLMDPSFIKSWGFRNVTNLGKWAFFKKHTDALKDIQKTINKNKFETFMKSKYIPKSNYAMDSKTIMIELLNGDDEIFKKAFTLFINNLKGKMSQSTSNNVKLTELEYILPNLLNSVDDLKKHVLIIDTLDKLQIKQKEIHYKTKRILTDNLKNIYNIKYRELSKLNKKSKDKENNIFESYMHTIKINSKILKNTIFPFDAYSLIRYLSDKNKLKISSEIKRDPELFISDSPNYFIQQILHSLNYRNRVVYNKKMIPKDYLDFVNNLIDNKNLSFAMRSFFVNHFTSTFYQTKNLNSIIHHKLKFILLDDPDKININDFDSYLIQSLENFTNQSIDQDWLKQAEEVYSLWNKLMANNTVNYNAKSSSNYHKNFKLSCFNLFEISLKLGNKSKIENIFKKEHIALNNEPIAYMLLLSNGYEDIFANEYLKNVNNFDFNYLNNIRTYSCSVLKKNHRFGLHLCNDTIKEDDYQKMLIVINKIEKEDAKNFAQYILDVYAQKNIDSIEDKLKNLKHNTSISKDNLANLILRPKRDNKLKDRWKEYCSKENIVDIHHNNIEFKKIRYASFLKFLFEDNDFTQLNKILNDIATRAKKENDKNAIYNSFYTLATQYRNHFNTMTSDPKLKNIEHIDKMRVFARSLLDFEGITNQNSSKYYLLPYWFVLYLLETPSLEKTNNEVAILKKGMGRTMYTGSISSKLNKFTFLKFDDKTILNIYQCIINPKFQKSWGMRSVNKVRAWPFFKKYSKQIANLKKTEIQKTND